MHLAYLGYFHVAFYVNLIGMGKEINDFNAVVRADAPSRRGRQENQHVMGLLGKRGKSPGGG